MPSPILAPAAMLVLWSMIVLVWFTAVRFSAVARLPRDQLRKAATPGSRGQDLERLLPPRASWVSHNYTHLMEQPTVFYAAVLILAVADAGGGVSTALAWAYCGLRIAHSLWQGTANRLPVRMTLFALSSVCLIALSINAVRATV